MNNSPAPYSHEAHCAWLASLSADESLVVQTPSGYLMFFLMTAATKRWLSFEDLKPADRLFMLEKMHGMIDQYFTSEMLATIQPMGDIEYQIWREARSLDPPYKAWCRSASFEILTSPRVFWHFVTLNPSLLATIKIQKSNRASSAGGDHDGAAFLYRELGTDPTANRRPATSSAPRLAVLLVLQNLHWRRLSWRLRPAGTIVLQSVVKVVDISFEDICFNRLLRRRTS
jgi:hypothetical protein